MRAALSGLVPPAAEYRFDAVHRLVARREPSVEDRLRELVRLGPGDVQYLQRHAVAVHEQRRRRKPPAIGSVGMGHTADAKAADAELRRIRPGPRELLARDDQPRPALVVL